MYLLDCLVIRAHILLYKVQALAYQRHYSVNHNVGPIKSAPGWVYQYRRATGIRATISVERFGHNISHKL